VAPLAVGARPVTASTDRDYVITSTVTLDRVMFHRSEIAEALTPYYRRMAGVRRVDLAGYEIRHMIDGWGKTARAELRCPASWWQHLKLAVRTRWPRLFGRLAVRMERAVAENGVIVAGLQPALSNHLVIPYQAPTFWCEYLDDPRAKDEP
jgi:hypothetical protein